MKDQSKTKQVLIQELASLRQRIAVLEQSESEWKKAEEERKAHIRFLESLERVDQAIKQETDVEKMLWNTIKTVFSIFDCDRAWLLYPCDPDAPSFRVTVEINRPEYPGAKVLNIDVPMSPGEAQNMREALESDEPVTYTAGTERPISTAEQFGVQSQMFIPVYPTLGKPWVFGMHQCSYPRIWTEEEQKLCREIARRISNGLSSLLFLRELQKSEEKYRTLFEESFDGLFITSPGGRILDMNKKGVRMFGYDTKEEILSLDLARDVYANPADRKRILSLVNAQGSAEYEVVVKKKNGETMITQCSLTAVKDESGVITSCRGIIHDITERKQAEEALRRSEENFRHSFDDSPLGVRIVTMEGETIYANRAILDICGFDNLDELKATPSMKRYTPESYADFLIRREKRQQGVDVPSEYTIDIIRKDGEVRHLQVFRKEILWDGERQFHVLYNDITERKQAEEALQNRENLLQKIFDVLPVGLWFADKDGKLLRGNPAGVKIWGAEPKVAPAKYGVFKARRLPSGEEIAPEDWALVHTVKERVTVVDEMLEIDAFDGKKKVILNYTAPVLDDQGAIQGAIVVNLDITERKLAEEELKASRLQLRALAKRLQQIREEDRIAIAREIHDEMGGGLTGLKMDLSWLLRKMSNADSGKERVALMDKIHTSNVLIDHMIWVVRRISAHLRPSVLDDLGLIAALEWQLSEFTSRTEIPHEFTSTFEYVNMEEATAIAVFRIFQEALTNVARHSRATKVVVDLREGERSLFGDESFVLEIRDNGKGITQEEILNPESLGLLGMKERVLAFGGELSIRAESGGGTALVLKIPRKQGEAS